MQAAVGQDEPDRDELRTEPRHRTLKGARIIFNDGYSVFDCTVRNVSEHGALLQLGDPLGIPTRFELDLDQRRWPCTVRWRSDKAIGVSFDDAA